MNQSKTIQEKIKSALVSEVGPHAENYTTEELTKHAIHRYDVYYCEICDKIIAPAYLKQNHDFHNHYSYGP